MLSRILRRSPALLAAIALLAGLAVTLPAPAAAQDEPVVADMNGARVVVERAPFRLRFVDPETGKTVLQQAEGPGRPGGAGGVNPDAGGFDIGPEVAMYAPFPFEVGGEVNVQGWNSLWAGNMLVGGDAGVVHHATEVTSVERSGNALELEVATTDPQRTLTVTIAPDRGEGGLPGGNTATPNGTVRVQAQLSDPDGVSAIGDAFASGEDEHFHGFGGRHDSTDHRGHDFYNWVEQENFGTGPTEPAVKYVPGRGGDDYMFPNGPHAAYYVQSLFHSSRDYGFLLNETRLSRWRLAADRPDAWQVSVGDTQIDYTVAVGSSPETVTSLTAINGRHRVAPEWAMGPAVKRLVKVTGGQDYKADVESDLKKIEELDLNLTGYAFEGWGQQDYEWVKAVVDRLDTMGIESILYIHSYVACDDHLDEPGTFQEAAVENNYVADTAAGTPYFYFTTCPSAMIDFTDPKAVEWWNGRIAHLLDTGADGFMQDFGEAVYTDMHFANGETGVTMHNKYLNVYHATTRQFAERYMEENPDREVWFYTRAGYSGRPGSAAFENSNFPGDETTNWQESTGLPSIIPDMLNRGVGGAYGYTTDIGGYIDSYTEDLDKELYARWIQASALMNHMRVHNSCCDQGTRMPWSFDEELLNIWKKYSALHNDAMPLLRALWEDAQTSGQPVMRPLWLEYPGDDQAVAQDFQFMVGKDVLVAPVVADGAREFEVYFPQGCWEHGETGERVEGPKAQTVDAPLDTLPWYFRCGVNSFEEAAARVGTPQAGTSVGDGAPRPAPDGTDTGSVEPGDGDATTTPATGGGFAGAAATLVAAALAFGRRRPRPLRERNCR